MANVHSGDIAWLQDYIWNDERPYWVAERHLNVLRRVCKPWRAFLSHYQHRFVRILDLRHELIPTDVLKKAIRVRINCAGCRCLKYCTDFSNNGNRYPFKSGSILEFFKRLDATVPWEIVTVEGPGFMMRDLFSLSSVLPSLKTLSGIYNVGSISAITNHFPNIRHVFTGDYWGNEDIRSTTLTSLSFSQRTDIPDAMARRLHIPNLQHLHVFLENLVEPFGSLLKVFGRQLRSLSCHQEYIAILPNDIWELCPNLEQIYIDIPPSPPPPNHPIRTAITNGPSYFNDEARNAIIFPRWPTLHRIVLHSCVWAQLRREIPYSLKSWAQECQKLDIRLEDMNGVLLEDFMKRTGMRFGAPVSLISFNIRL